ncbi:SET domain-containing protein-lysine N-methyltransferase [Candidatus Kaiserbacteria bacterium CG10_big_fil_rev_8_21_14_0_10_56_12]|uniref:SET domain-containing protein-lysine N-methyltransferase n=1 Tax=Candidatus Kaiserbacteria bacterium CG10_big_fil_rev_8_21_14_0_10_56_12 TaxID=1974611 RepID=A0A2H0UA46_9BACT|nr:MAG: SET domain-containing protein-lysine N-methyltransferase [Candidatus Kaiserbacteria bacterium CG10_big_fil_rev_8_21_14_0_10_56_12]
MAGRRSKYTPGEYKLRVRRSHTGKGLFTEQDIPKGACIIEYIGKPVSEEIALRDAGKYLFGVAPNRTIDGNIPENIARYINHSCAGNCEALGPAGRIFIFSRKKIPAGTELTYDYGKEYFDRHIKPRGCRCAKCSPV